MISSNHQSIIGAIFTMFPANVNYRLTLYSLLLIFSTHLPIRAQLPRRVRVPVLSAQLTERVLDVLLDRHAAAHGLSHPLLSLARHAILSAGFLLFLTVALAGQFACAARVRHSLQGLLYL